MVSHENRGPQLEAIAIMMVVLTVTAFGLRAYVRTRMVKAYGWDDWFMSFAAVTFILFVACVLTGVHYGTGRLRAVVSDHDYDMAMQYWLYCYIWYCWTMIFSKISIAIFLIRIIVEKVHLMLIYVALFINVLSGLAFFLVTMLQCHPVSYFWNKNQDGYCISVDIIIALTYVYSVFNIICDFTFALLPIVIVKGLNMNRKLKIAIIPLLSMGCVASSAVVVRLAYVQTFRDPEYLYATTDIAIWSTVEAGLAVSAGSLACLRPLFKVIVQQLGWQSEAYFRPSVPLPESGKATHGATMGSHKKGGHHGDSYHMSSLFSRTGDDRDDSNHGDDGDNHSVGTASTTKLVTASGGGIMKTSAFTVKVEELGSESAAERGTGTANASHQNSGPWEGQPGHGRPEEPGHMV